jgi:hypothetical protein
MYVIVFILILIVLFNILLLISKKLFHKNLNNDFDSSFLFAPPVKPADKKPKPQVPPKPPKPQVPPKPPKPQDPPNLGTRVVTTTTQLGSGNPIRPVNPVGNTTSGVATIFMGKNRPPPSTQRDPKTVYVKDPKTSLVTNQYVSTTKATYQGASVPVLTVGGSSAVLVNGKPVYGTVIGGTFRPGGSGNPVLQQLVTGKTQGPQVAALGTQAAKDIASFATGPQVVSTQGQSHTVQQGNKATMNGKPVSTITIDGKTYANSGGKLYEGTVSGGAFKPTGQVNAQGQVLDSNGRPVRGTGSPFLATLAAGAATGGAIGASVGSVVPIVGTAIGAGLGAAIGTGGAIIANFLGGFKPPKPTTTLGPAKQTTVSASQVNPNTTYVVYNKEGKPEFYNPVVGKNGTVSFQQCGGRPGERSLSSCAATIAIAGASVWNAIQSQKKGPVTYLAGVQNGLAKDYYKNAKGLFDASVNAGITYGDYVQNAVAAGMTGIYTFQQYFSARQTMSTLSPIKTALNIPKPLLTKMGITNTQQLAQKAAQLGLSLVQYVESSTRYFPTQTPVSDTSYATIAQQYGMSPETIFKPAEVADLATTASGSEFNWLP